MFKKIISLLIIGSALVSVAAQASDHCESIELRDGTTITQCDSVSYPEESQACEDFAANYGTDFEMAYEACMTIAIHTPGAVKAP